MSEKIRVVCPECGKGLVVAATSVGKTGKCPSCKESILIEAPPVTKKRPAAAAVPPVATPTARPVPNEEPPSVRPKAPTKPRPSSKPPEIKVVEVPLAQQPTHREEFSQDQDRMRTAVSIERDKFKVVEPYLMKHERPVAIAVQRQFPFSIFSDIVLLSTHRLMVFKRFFTKVTMFDINYIDFDDVKISQGFFTSTLTVRGTTGQVCRVPKLITAQALDVYRQCQDIETKARVARRQFQLEENRSRTNSLQVNNLVAPPHPQYGGNSQPPMLGHQNISNVGDEERDPFLLGE